MPQIYAAGSVYNAESMNQTKRLKPRSFAVLFLSIALAIVTLLAYCRSMDNSFVAFDDQVYVTRNRHVEAGLTLSTVRWAFTSFTAANWHPLTWLSLQLDCVLYGGLKPGGFHLTNVLLHTANALLLFLILVRLTERVWRSAAVTALFALHPLHVESVAWVAERKDVLSALFWMLTLGAYVAYARRPTIGRYLLVVLALGLGLLAKPMLVTLPFVLLLLDYWPLGRWRGRRSRPGEDSVTDTTLPALSGGRLVLEKLPLFAMVLASCVITFVAQHDRHAVMSIAKFPVSFRLENAILAYVGYLGKAIWPVHLAAYYPHPREALSVLKTVAAGLLLVVITAAVLWPGRHRGYLVVGWFWYLGTLVPVIGLVQVGGQAMADRYTYIPLIGVFLLLTWVLADVTTALRLPRIVPAAIASVVLTACTVLTWIQIGYWRDDRALWEHAIEASDNNAFAHAGLGMYYYEHNLLRPAKEHLEKAVAIDPANVQAHTNLGKVYWVNGQWDEALQHYHQAVDVDPESATSRAYLGRALAQVGRSEEALAEFRKAIESSPDLAVYHLGVGMTLRDLGRLDEALVALQKAVELESEDAEAHGTLGETLLEQGRYEEAEQSFQRELELLPAGHRLRDTAYGELERCRRLAALEPRLLAALEGNGAPLAVIDRLDLALLCQQPRHNRQGDAAQLYIAVFAADPDLAAPHRYEAACAAALAGCGRDVALLDEHDRSRLRQQALDWLRADLTVQSKEAASRLPANRALVQKTLRRSQQETALAGVRGTPLEMLPETERGAWAEFWQDVDAALTKAKN